MPSTPAMIAGWAGLDGIHGHDVRAKAITDESMAMTRRRWLTL